MPINIKSEETDQLARRLARLTGETITEAVTKALRQRLERETEAQRLGGLASRQEELREIRTRAGRIPRKSDLSPDELVGYDENGLWG